MYCMQQYSTRQVITDVTAWHFMSCVSVDSTDAMMSVNGSTMEVARDNHYDTLGHHLAQIVYTS